MKVLVTGICGYVGSRMAAYLKRSLPGSEVLGIDNLSRRGSETSIHRLTAAGIPVHRGDIRQYADIEALPAADWVIDCAANSSVLAGAGGSPGGSAEQLVGHNLGGALNILEYCRRNKAGLVLLSTSRVYSIAALSQIPLRETASRFELDAAGHYGFPGLSEHGISENFPTDAPVSLYGATKRSSEIMALEYGAAFGFPVWINRCGVIGGPGQFGRVDQGIFSFWAYSIALGRPLSYIGFGGKGKQVRDCVSPEDVAALVREQIQDPHRAVPRIVNVGGGNAGALSLAEVTAMCEKVIGKKASIESSSQTRPYDIPYFVTDTRKAYEYWGWQPSMRADRIISELCEWAVDNSAFVQTLFE